MAVPTELPEPQRNHSRTMLSRCISTDANVFAREVWGRRPLLTRSAALPRDFGDLLSSENVDELIAERGVRTPFKWMAKDGDLISRDCYAGPAGFGAEMPDQVDSAKVLAEFAAGATIVLQGLHRLWPPIIDFVRGLIDDLGHPVQANAYITPPANRGFDPHYDVHDVFVLQADGRKRWTVHAPVHTDPLVSQPWTDHREAIEERVRDEPILDTVLEPGDALYLPRGWVHSAKALGHTSIHLTIGVAAITVFDVVRAVTDKLAANSELRSSLPMGVDLTDPDETTAIATKAVAGLIDVLRERETFFDEAVGAKVTARFSERTRPAAVRPIATLREVSALGDDTAVRWRHGLIASVRVHGERVELRLPDRVVTFPGLCAPALRALQTGHVYTAPELPGLDTHDALVVLRRLLREAVVVVSRPAESASSDSFASGDSERS